jgi:hypothetical protein
LCPAFKVAAVMAIVHKPKPAAQPGHDVFVVILGEVIGVALLAIVADMNDELGRIAVALMVGWLLIFLMTHDLFLKGLVGKL